MDLASRQKQGTEEDALKTKSSKMKSLCKSISAAMHYEESAVCCPWIIFVISFTESESHSVLSNSLRLHGVYHPWNSPGQNTRVGSLSLLQGIFPTQGLNPGLPHCRWILYQLSHKGSPKILSHSVMSDSLQSHGLYSLWNSPGQHTGVSNLSLL